MMWVAIIAVLVIVIGALIYMFMIAPTPSYAPSSYTPEQGPARQAAQAPALPEEQDLQAIDVDNLDQGLQDIDATLAR